MIDFLTKYAKSAPENFYVRYAMYFMFISSSFPTF